MLGRELKKTNLLGFRVHLSMVGVVLARQLFFLKELNPQDGPSHQVFPSDYNLWAPFKVALFALRMANSGGNKSNF